MELNGAIANLVSAGLPANQALDGLPADKVGRLILLGLDVKKALDDQAPADQTFLTLHRLFSTALKLGVVEQPIHLTSSIVDGALYAIERVEVLVDVGDESHSMSWSICEQARERLFGHDRSLFRAMSLIEIRMVNL